MECCLLPPKTPRPTAVPAQVLAYLPQLQKLDDALVTPDEVEEAQARYPDAPHGVSTDGGGGGSEGGDWDGQRSRVRRH